MKKIESGFSVINNLGWDVATDRPCVDLYFMNFCFDANLRSVDRSSKCGCVVKSKRGSLVCSGYNNPIRGSDDVNVPQTRPEKYHFFEHSERNLIYNAAAEGISLDDCIFYVTGFPCIDCLRAMIQAGGKKIIYGPLQTKMSTPLTVYEELLKDQSVVIERFKYDEGLYLLNIRAKEAIGLKQIDGIEDITFEWNK